jgi:hypothetical protein
MADRRDILAVQTLRNWSTAASFLATTAILIATGALRFLTTIPQQPELLHHMNCFGSTSPNLITLKLFVIVATLLIAFFHFAVSIRYYNHVSIEINVRVDPEIWVFRQADHLRSIGGAGARGAVRFWRWWRDWPLTACVRSMRKVADVTVTSVSRCHRCWRATRMPRWRRRVISGGVSAGRMS